ncbi:MAG TPA: phosphotransferase [Thermomicrobiales bacterium]|nr:phosphotransferase [Thermomicrobiales bacterium]
MMIEPEIEAFLAQRHGPGLSCAREPLSSAESASGATLERITVTNAAGQHASYVVKRLSPLGDWIARATRDERMREYQLAASAIPGALPSAIGTAVAGATTLATGGAALIMRDVSDCLALPGDEPFSRGQTTRALEGLAQLHSTFYGFPARLMSGLGLCSLGSWLTLLAPATGRREANPAPGSVPSLLVSGWATFATQEPAAWRLLGPLLDDPGPVVTALRECPDTFIHGDPKAGNLVFEDGQVVLLDWALSARAPGAIDLGWFLAVNSAKLPMPREEAIETYRAERERLRRLPSQGQQWERELALGLLAGTLRLGWAKALGAASGDPKIRERERAEVAWWADAAIRAQRWL